MEYHYKDKQNSEFNLVDTSMLKFHSKNINQDCYKIIWAKGDEITLGVDGYRVFLKKNQLLFTTPLNKLDLQIENKEIIVYSFNREFYCIRDHDSEVACNGFLFLGSSQPIMVGLTEKEQKSFTLLYDFFVEEFEETDDIQGEMLLVLLKRLLIKSVRIARKTLPKADMPKSKLDIIRKFNLLVEMHFREKHKVAEYAELLNVSPKSLSNVFLRYYSKSPLKVISERICLEGERLIRYSDKNMNEIAYFLGFNEASHFSKFFKKHTGKSPKAYKLDNSN
ncbi:AraC family transcriptional regulator [Winogradskyella sp.]|uniref:helix-turn-helix domain-containing protein n=1 Tax=Winogradskyella sp. TaxID=1883156 RepID=UPI0025D41D10|nr:AraC family transcriptional regulator [Winogradskyella sp.]